MENKEWLSDVKDYFEGLIRLHGATPVGADYNGEESQLIRYNQLSSLFREEQFTLLDYGSSYGAFAQYILGSGRCTSYCGYDVIESVVESANAAYAADSRVVFKSVLDERNDIYDYVIASGTFNYKGTMSEEEWEVYVLGEIDIMSKLSRRGFASNFLTKYSDPEKMKEHLYYPDPCRLFDVCKRKYSRNVALLHDYNLYDFTLVVRK